MDDEVITIAVAIGFVVTIGTAIYLFWRVEQFIDNYHYGGDKKVKTSVTLGRIKGSYVKDNNITEFTITTEAKTNPKYGKLECDVLCNDKAKSQGYWQLSIPANNSLCLQISEETLEWIGKKIPVTTKEYDSGLGIIVDEEKLKELYPKQETL